MRRRASPRLRQPQTNGTLKLCFRIWFSSSAGSQHLGLVDVVDAHGFQDLRFDEMPDAAFGHDRDGDRIHDLEDQVRVGHARHAALGADIRRDTFQRHDGAGAGIFGDLGMLGGDHVHDHAAFEHLGQAFFDGKCTSLLFHMITPLCNSAWVFYHAVRCKRGM